MRIRYCWGVWLAVCDSIGCKPPPPTPPTPYSQVEALTAAPDMANTVQEKDPSDPPSLWDYHDAPFNPPASHASQYWEWLGPAVSVEAGPLPDDQFDDSVSLMNPQNFRPGNQLTIAVVVCSRFPEHPAAFSAQERGGLGVWIDWDYDKTFVAAENVFREYLDIRFRKDEASVHCGRVTFTAAVPATFQLRHVSEETPEGHREGFELPALRARANYNTFADIEANGFVLPDVGGHTGWGEVEDIDLDSL